MGFFCACCYCNYLFNSDDQPFKLIYFHESSETVVEWQVYFEKTSNKMIIIRMDLLFKRTRSNLYLPSLNFQFIYFS